MILESSWAENAQFSAANVPIALGWATSLGRIESVSQLIKAVRSIRIDEENRHGALGNPDFLALPGEQL